MIDSPSCAFTAGQAASSKTGWRYFWIGQKSEDWTTKMHLRVVGNGLPVQIELSAG